jgi:hypothetical protein
MNTLITYWKIKRSGLFDPVYYLKTYADVRQADVDPLRHFCTKGWREDRNPSAHFNTRQYLIEHPELKESGTNPLLHYIEAQEIDANETTLAAKVGTVAKSIAKDPTLLKKFIDEVRTKGLGSAIAKLKFSTQRRIATQQPANAPRQFEPVFPDRRLAIVPYYINPDPASHHSVTLDEQKVAIHLHLTDASLIDSLFSRLHLGKPFDLFLTLAESLDPEAIETKAKETLKELGTLTTRTTPEETGAMMALLGWGEALLGYPLIGHFHTDLTQCPDEAERWYEEALDRILDEAGQCTAKEGTGSAAGGWQSHLSRKHL